MAGYWVNRGGKTIGPLSSEQLKSAASKGQVKATDSIGKSADGPWTLAEKVPQIAIMLPTEIATIEPQSVSVRRTEQIARHESQGIYEPEIVPPAQVAPQIVYVTVPQQAPAPAINIVNQVTSTNVNTNTNTNKNTNVNWLRSYLFATNGFASLAFFMFVIAVIGGVFGKKEVALIGGSCGVLSALLAAVLSFVRWGRGLIVAGILFVANMLALGLFGIPK